MDCAAGTSRDANVNPDCGPRFGVVCVVAFAGMGVSVSRNERPDVCGVPATPAKPWVLKPIFTFGRNVRTIGVVDGVECVGMD